MAKNVQNLNKTLYDLPNGQLHDDLPFSSLPSESSPSLSDT
ncbi:hypothetical protein TcasGA2_TC033473 [Tribolium castaneum]|uniref:Uncharacterized protein n=1 Tax=Tribolium castaneum TaxID=7070 RepID=A0A139WGB9_TRICA|nr:hypothetical protein TcasGA2_TC033473 [Tribolium castaneum]